MSRDLLDELRDLTDDCDEAPKTRDLALRAIDEIRRLRVDVDGYAYERVRVATGKDLREATPIDAERCPVCGRGFFWRLSAEIGSTARAKCQSYQVGVYCGWKGTQIARRGDGAVVVLQPMELARNDHAWMKWRRSLREEASHADV